MNNMNGTLDMQKRMLLMTVIILVIFISYEFLVLKPQKDLRLESRTSIDLISRNKLVMEQGDSIYVGCPENTAVEFYLSVATDVI